MKKIKLGSIYRIILVLAFTGLFSALISAQVVNKTISKSTQIANDITVEVHGSSCDVDINTWDKNQVKADYVIETEAKTNEEVNMFISALEAALDKQMNSKTSILKISLPLKRMMQNGRKVEIELEGNSKTFHLTKFKASMIIYIPKQNNLEAKSSFSKLSIGTLSANADVTISSGQLEMGECKNLKLNASFSKNIKIGNVESAELYISSSDMEMGEIKNNLKLKGSFSGFKVAKIGNIANLDLSSSTFETTDIKELNLNASFVRHFKIRNAEKAGFKLSSSEFEAMSIKTVNISSVSFSTIRIDEVEKLNAPKSSSSKFYIKKANVVEVINSSFSDFYINSLKSSFTTKASSGSIHLTNVANGFDKIDIDGQFVSIEIGVEESANYLISADLEFPNYNFKEITFQNRDKDMSKETFKGWKGSNKNVSSEISFNCKSCNIRLN